MRPSSQILLLPNHTQHQACCNSEQTPAWEVFIPIFQHSPGSSVAVLTSSEGSLAKGGFLGIKIPSQWHPADSEQMGSVNSWIWEIFSKSITAQWGLNLCSASGVAAPRGICRSGPRTGAENSQLKVKLREQELQAWVTQELPAQELLQPNGAEGKRSRRWRAKFNLILSLPKKKSSAQQWGPLDPQRETSPKFSSLLRETKPPQEPPKASAEPPTTKTPVPVSKGRFSLKPPKIPNSFGSNFAKSSLFWLSCSAKEKW